jgi:F0F1-type ATP synthase epsilon subunit
MTVRIFSLRGAAFQGESAKVIAPTREGQITVLDHHQPLISVLAKGKVVVTRESGERQEFPVVSGVLEMDPANNLTLLIHS